MKKKLSAILALLLALSMALTGCENADGLQELTGLTGAMGENSKAAVYYHDEWHYYDTCAQAWATANAWNEDYCLFRLLTDWVADENGSFDDHGGYGDNGWGFHEGMLNFEDRGTDGGNPYAWFEVDLNGHTIDKNLYSAGSNHDFANPVKNNRKKYGKIFRIDDIDDRLNVHIMNGTLRGANSNDEGGAIWMDDKDVNLQLSDITITDNCSEKDGSAIYAKNCKSLELKNVDIEWNFCDEDDRSTGAVNFHDGDFYLYGTIHIRENFSRVYTNLEHGQNNLIMDTYLDRVDVNTTKRITLGTEPLSEIHLSNVTTYKCLDGYRRLNEKVNNGENPHFSPDAFVLDEYLISEGARQVVMCIEGLAKKECFYILTYSGYY